MYKKSNRYGTMKYMGGNRMKSFSLHNIKSFVSSGDIEIKPITIFVGKNSCGKSSLIRFLAVLAQTVMSTSDAPILLSGNLIDYGDYEDVIHNHDMKKELSFEIAYEVNINNLYDARYKKNIKPKDDKRETYFLEATLEIHCARMENHIVVTNVILYAAKKELSQFKRDKDGKYKMILKGTFINKEYVPLEYETYIEDIMFNFFFPIYDGAEFFERVYLDTISVPEVEEDEILDKYTEFAGLTYADVVDDDSLSDEEKEVVKIFSSMMFASNVMSFIYQGLLDEAIQLKYIGPFRISPNRVYRDSEISNRSVGVQGENISNMLVRDHQRNGQLLEDISDWFNNAMGYSIGVSEIGKGFFQLVAQKANNEPNNLMDVGYGISQVLPIITQLMESKRRFSSNNSNELILIEQPEIHLHPAAQAELASILVSCAKSCEGKRLLIETHSEHLIRKLQALIADPDINIVNEDVKIYYVDQNENSEAIVKEMKILQNGKFEKQWPSGFFDKAHELTLQLMDANSKRKV